MFMGGGMVAPMPQPTYMDLMPQQMGIPREAQGIMASSQPLVDAIAGDANNPAGGDTLSMAQGGAVGFAPGGIALGQAPASFEKGKINTLTPEVVFEQGVGTVSRVPQNPIRMDFDTILNETNAERLERIFPEAAKNRFQATYEQEFPRDPDGPPPSYAEELAGRVLGGARSAVRSQLEEVGQDISAIYNVLFTGEGREQFGDRDKDAIIDEIGTARAVAELVQRRPDLKDRVVSLSQTIIDNARRDGTELDGRKLKDTVAYGLSMESEINPNIGFATAQADADRPAVDADPPPPEPAVLGEGPALNDPILSLEGLEDERALRPEGPLDVEGEIDPDDDSDVPRPKKKPPVPEDAQEQATTATSEAAAAAAEGEASATGGEAAAQVAKAFDKPMTKPEAKKTIEDYKEQFLKAMPEFEGATEEEKGLRFVEAGLRVMAGQSPNAIENIANGLKGLGAEFAKDKKEKRAYDRQVDLSAAKYALEGIQRDEVKAAALAKEKRALLQKVFVVRAGQKPFTYKGQLLEPGDRFIPDVGSIQDGTFPIDRFQTETSFIDALKAARAKTKASLELLSKQVIAPSKMESTSKQYIADTMRLRTNVATQSLLSRALVELQKPGAKGPLGVMPTARRMLLGFANSLGKKEYAEKVFGDLSSQKDFDDFTNRAVTTQIEGLINEGGKITDQERELAKEIGGALSRGAFSGVFEDADKLERQIVEFSQGLQRDSESRIRSINLAETRWDKHFRSMDDLERGYSYGDILRESRSPIGGQNIGAPITSRVIPKTLNYRDLVIVGEDGKIEGFNPNWDKSE